MASKIEEKAKKTFRGGLNCAQAVVSSFSEKLGFDKEMSLQISCGFGGGMGRMQGTCGAVTGSYMVLGIANCQKYTDNSDRKMHTYEMVREFNRKFTEIHKTTSCIDLLNCEIATAAGHDKAKEKNLFVTVCEKCISDSIGIIEEMI
jgi:C_GCAxxG_C_C family probable redox protein